MDRIIVDFKDVRGLGNIVSPPKELADYTPYYGRVSESTDMVAGQEFTVYKLLYGAQLFLLSVSKSYVQDGGTVTVSVELTDSEGVPVEGASVELFKEVTG